MWTDSVACNMIKSRGANYIIQHIRQTGNMTHCEGGFQLPQVM